MSRKRSRQLAATLPYTFDEWRARYDELPYDEHVLYYDHIYERFPVQRHCDMEAALAFAASLPDKSNVLELGGWDGHVAAELLESTTSIRHWHNYEVCQQAVQHGLRHPRYTAIVAPDFVWNLPELPECNVLFAAHVIEHLKAAQIEKLLARLDYVTQAYVEAPIADTADSTTWTGNLSTHVLEIGWQELELLFRQFGFEPVEAKRNIRMFQRARSTGFPPTTQRDWLNEEPDIGENVTIHPTANIYRTQIGNHTKIAAFVEIGGAQIGSQCKIQAHAFIPPGVTIADEVFIGPGVRFTNDPYPRATGDWNIVATRVEAGASIGAGAVILPGVTIGAAARVGAGSVVTCDVPPRTCFAGNPAKLTSEIPQGHNGRDVLMIWIEETATAEVDAYNSLPIDRVCFSNHSSHDLTTRLNRFIEETRYRNYLLTTGNALVNKTALDCVQRLLRTHPAATGFCQCAETPCRVELARRPVESNDLGIAELSDDEFYTWDEIQRFPAEFVSWFGNWSLTGMRRDLWLEYPFQARDGDSRKTAVDTAHRMSRDGRCFFSHRQARMQRLITESSDIRRDIQKTTSHQPNMNWEFYNCESRESVS